MIDVIDGVDGGDWMVGLMEETGQKVEEVTVPLRGPGWQGVMSVGR